MKLSIFLLLIPFWTFGQSGLEIIMASNERIKNLKTISYNIYDENTIEKVTADVTIQRGEDIPVLEAKVKVNGIVMSNAGSKQISFSFNGQSFDFIDVKTSQMTRLDSISYNKLGRTGLMQYTLLALAPYRQKEPFEILLKQLTKAEKLQDTLIYNVPCFAIRITMEVNSEAMGKQTIESTWYIDKEKFLICGKKSKTNQQFLKIRSTNEEYTNDYFSLAAVSEVRKITGLEPIGEGLLKVGSKAPDWSLPSSENKALSLSDFKGKVILLDFWGTWCMPCLKAMPEIQGISDLFKNEQVVVMGVSVETEKNADPVGYMKRKGYTYTTLTDGARITKDYKVAEFPSIYLIDKDGIVIHAEHGGNRENFKEDMIDRIKKAINKL
ncbi:MAG: TlpA family protein disulfide reductase [Chitinophagales bacterium]|nr:TlpA family protein disulfide reductase [Chitinophagales bacterium]